MQIFDQIIFESVKSPGQFFHVGSPWKIDNFSVGSAFPLIFNCSLLQEFRFITYEPSIILYLLICIIIINLFFILFNAMFMFEFCIKMIGQQRGLDDCTSRSVECLLSIQDVSNVVYSEVLLVFHSIILS